MTAVQQRVHVAGFAGRLPPLAAVRALIDWLCDGIDRAIRLRLEGRSSALGPRPRWSVASREIGVGGLAPGSIDLDLTIPTLGDLLGASAVWQQPGLFLAQPRAEQTPLDVYAEAVRDAMQERGLDATGLDTSTVTPSDGGAPRRADQDPTSRSDNMPGAGILGARATAP